MKVTTFRFYYIFKKINDFINFATSLSSLAWLFFSRIKKSDVHVFLDDVQIEKTQKQFYNRNKLRNKSDIFWLTVPLKSTKNGDPKILDTKIDNSQSWQKKHFNSFQVTIQNQNIFMSMKIG